MKSPRPACRLAALLGIGAGVLATPALTQDCPELIGLLPGPISAVAVSGNYAYLGGVSALFIADISDPTAPWAVGVVNSTDHASGVAVEGDYAYVVGNDLSVVDVSAPAAPVSVGLVHIGWNRRASGVAVTAGYAYVISQFPGLVPDRLHVFDVSTPSAPVEVWFVEISEGVYDVALSGGYAYVVGEDLSVFDVSTPSAPVLVGKIGIPSQGTAVAVSGDYAYVVEAEPEVYSSLVVFDVSTPSAPVEVGFVGWPAAWAEDVAVSDGLAYVVGSRLAVIDVSMPSAPAEVGFIENPASAAGIAISGVHAYVADGSGRLRVIDVSTPSSPVETALVDTLDGANKIAVAGHYAYITDGFALRVLDVSRPSAPVVVGFLETPDWGTDVVVSEDHAYVGIDFFGLLVVDVTTPSVPAAMGAVVLPGRYTPGVAVSGGYAYVADWDGGLSVIDASDPRAPVEVGFFYMGGYAEDVAVSGGHAYVLEHLEGLRVIDVSVPSNPEAVGFVEVPLPISITLSGSHAYVAAGSAGLRVIDVSTPSAPAEVGFLDELGDEGFMDVAVSGHYAYVAASSGSLRVIDVSDPSAPVESGFAKMPGASWGVDGSGGHVYATAGSAGLVVCNECRPLSDVSESFIPAAAAAAGAQGAFFQTDVEVNNTGREEAQVSFQWLPRGEDNIEPVQSDPVALAAGQSRRFDNILTTVFGLGPDTVGAIKLVASTDSVIGMSRTYNIPAGKAAGSFGQGLPAIRATEMIMGTESRRIIFLSENGDARANVGCVNGSSTSIRIHINVFDDQGTFLQTETMHLEPYSNNQINRIFRDYQPINGYVDVWANSDEALYYCYGSVLDNSTSDPTTILPQTPSADMTFVPAAALSAGLEGSFFQTDVDLNNVGSTDLTYELLWLPRGEDNTDAVHSDTFSLAPGAGVRYANVLDEVFGLEPDQVGSLAIEASGTDLLAMSRTYNIPSTKVVGTFGQELPGIPVDRMIPTGEKKRIIFLSENDDVRSNVGCQNGSRETLRVFIELFNSEGESLETKYLALPPYSNRQINGIFEDYAPVNGYVDVRTYTPDASIYCYGSVLDNVTSDPTTVLPQ